LLVLLQERTTIRGEKAAQSMWVARINRQVSENIFSSLASPANYVFVRSLKRSPMNDTAVSGSPTRMFPRQVANRIDPRGRMLKGTAKVEAAVPQSWWPAGSRQGPVRGQYTLRCGLGTDPVSHENGNVDIPELSSPFCPGLCSYFRTSAAYSSHSESPRVDRQY
jgi:hypothetical protein